MNEHEKINELLVKYTLGELSQEQASEVQTHLAGCPECSGEIKRLEALLECTERIRESTVDEQTCQSAKQAILQTIESQEMKKQTSGPNIRLEYIRKTIIKNPVTKIAAAAVIIIAAILMLQNGSVNITSTAFGLDDFIAAISKAKWVYITTELTKANVESVESEQELLKRWISVSPERNITVSVDGFIKYTEHNNSKNEIKTQIYDPLTNTITTTYRYTWEDYLSSDPIIASFRGEISFWESIKGKTQFTDTIYDGKPAKIINIRNIDGENMPTELSVVVDARTQLPQFLTMHIHNPSGTKTTTNSTFHYPDKGPTDIHQAGAPENAKVLVNDYRPDEEFLEIIKPYRVARENLPKQCIVVDLENENNSQYRVCVIYKNGVKKERFEQLMWIRNDTPPDTEDFDKIMDWISRAKSDELGIQIYNGEYMYRSERDYRDRWTQNKHYSPRKPEYVVGGFIHRGWPKVPNGKPVENSYANKNNLLCIETLRKADIEENQLIEPTEKTLYYIDPEHDYICVRIESFSYLTPPYGKLKIDDLSFEPNEVPTKPYWVTKVTQFGQIDTGQWYPKEITTNRLSWWLDYPGNTDTPEDEKFVIKLYVETNPEFPEGIFDPNNLPKQEN